jgi:predicted dehydrogenase
MISKAFFISRRSFLKRCSLAAAATGLPVWFIERDLMGQDAAKPASPNDRPAIALVGCGGQGRGDAANAQRFADILAVCDVDDHHSAAAAKQYSGKGKTPDVYNDFRKVMERKDIHAIITATPDHWHTLVNLAAAQAGKDTYGEKPLTLTISEGQHMVRAVHKNKTVFQTGTQQRSSGRFRLACELVRNGRLGQLTDVTVWLPAGLRDGPFATKPVPTELNWDFWLGQAPKVDYVPQRCHVNFRFWYDYAGGTLTDWGPHHNDIVLWALGVPGPATVEATRSAEPVPGGYTAYSDYEVHFTYANGVRHTVKTTRDDSIYGGIVNENGQRNGIKFEGRDGWIWVNRGEIEASDPSLLSTPLPSGATRLIKSDDHMKNFIDCIRSRQLPVADVEAGHRSASICHLGVIALRLGRKLQWDAAGEKFTGEGSQEAGAWLAREMREPYNYQFA